jgi:C4-dicarboxylate-specific signal transduction histidine kinase
LFQLKNFHIETKPNQTNNLGNMLLSQNGPDKFFRRLHNLSAILVVIFALLLMAGSTAHMLSPYTAALDLALPSMIVFLAALILVTQFLAIQAIRGNDKQELIDSQSRVNADLRIANAALTEEVRQRKEAEQAARESLQLLSEAQARLISAGRMGILGEMATGISHEMNNPLTILRGYLFMTQDMLRSEAMSPDKLMELNLKSIQVSERMARIVKGLAAFANERERSEIESFCLRDCVERSLTFCRERLVSHGIGLILDDWSSEIMAMARPADLTQIVISLVMNAADAVERSEARWIRISARATYSRIILRIVDSGNGIEPKVAQKMFIPFFSTKDGGSGNGMGLSVAKTLINASGGDIRYIASEANTTFEIELVRSVETGARIQVV